MTVSELITKLSEIRALHGPDCEILLSIDEEGKQFKPIDGVFQSKHPETGKLCRVIYPAG